MGQNNTEHRNEGLGGRAFAGNESKAHNVVGHAALSNQNFHAQGIASGTNSTYPGAVGISDGNSIGGNSINLGIVTTDGSSSMAMGSYSTVIGSSRTSERKPREVTITPLDFGFIVKVGCQSVAVENVEKLVEKLSAYLKNPGNIEDMWNKDSGKTVMNEFVEY